jgi:hypothetical protein
MLANPAGICIANSETGQFRTAHERAAVVYW